MGTQDLWLGGRVIEEKGGEREGKVVLNWIERGKGEVRTRSKRLCIGERRKEKRGIH